MNTPAADTPGRKTMAPLFILLALATGSLWLGLEMLTGRFARGTDAPAYAVQRTDPRGLSALYNALQTADGLEVTRNIAYFDSAFEAPENTVFYVGARLGPDSVDTLDSIEGFLTRGGRIVLAFRPINSPAMLGMLADGEEAEEENAEEDADAIPVVVEPADETADDTLPNGDEADEDDVEDGEDEEPGAGLSFGGGEMEDISERFGFDYGFREVPQHEDGRLVPFVATPAQRDLPRLSWYSGAYFRLPEEDVGETPWEALYSAEDEPVMIRRPVGAGELIVASDSYFLSNEGLAEQPPAELIVTLIGDSRRVVFDQTHLGIQRYENIMTLVWRYRLHGFALMLLLLALLYIWRNAVPLVPRPALEESWERAQAGRGAASALQHLLEHNMKPEAALTTCLREWQETPGGRHDPATRAAVERVYRDSAAEGPVTRYRVIARVLQERMRKGEYRN